MEIQEIEITIEKNGQVKLHVRGAKGATCLDLTQELEQALGGELLERQLTPEADEGSNPVVDQSLHIKGKS